MSFRVRWDDRDGSFRVCEGSPGASAARYFDALLWMRFASVEAAEQWILFHGHELPA